MAPTDCRGDSARPLLVGNEWVSTRAGGLNRYLADLMVALDRAGARPVALVVGAGQGKGVVGVSGPDAGLVRRLLAVRRAAARLAAEVDVVDVHFALYGLLPVWTTRLRRRPLVVHFHGPWAGESAVARGQRGVVVRAKGTIERAVYRRATTVVVLSAAFGRLVVERYGVDPARVVVVPPGVDLERFRPGDRAAARRRLGLPGDRFVAVAVRRLDARMGLDVLVDAWGQVQAACPGAVLVIAGEGRERPRLEQARAALADPSGVRLAGRVGDDELVELYRAADCSVVPTRALEGFGLVTLESAACGTPAVVTDVGGLPDGVVGLDPTLVVPAGDAPALADRLVAAADGDLPSPEVARRHAEGFSWDQVARRHLDLYAAAVRPRLRVAYIGHTAALSGGELALARTLRALGDDVDAHVLLAEDGPLVERLRSAGATVEVLPMGERTRALRKGRVSLASLPVAALWDTAAYSLRLARRLRRVRPDVVHTNTLKAALYGGAAGRLAGIPVVWHVRDRITADYLPRPTVALVRVASRVLPAVVVANSQATLATLGRWPRRSAVVPSPVEQPAPGEPAVASGQDRPFTVGLVGRLAPWKGQDVFLRAFASAFAGGDARAVIAGSALFGEDDWAASLSELAESLGIAGQVELTGFVDDVGPLYRRLDVLVHASTIPEPFGQVVVEGMAAGLPVVAADAGGPAEIITDGVDGLLYPMGDAEALTRHLRTLASEPPLRQHLGTAATRRAAQFLPERVADQLMDVYRGMAEPSPHEIDEGESQPSTAPATERALARASLLLAGVTRQVPIRGRGRLAHELHRRFGSTCAFDRDVRLRRGLRLTLPMTSSQSWRAAFTAGYDDEVIDYLEQFIEPGSLVIDVGASLGLYALPLAGHAAAIGATVLAVEPMPGNASIIRENAACNGLGGTITVALQAVGAERGELLLHSEPGGVGNAAATSGVDHDEMERHDAAGGQTHVESVEVTPLDDLVDDTRGASLMKIDVEGFEFDVLVGAHRTISVHRPVIYTEMSPAWLRSRRVPESSLSTWLSDNRYRCFELNLERVHSWSDRGRVVLREIEHAGDRSGADLLLLPAERGVPVGLRGQ